MLTLDGLAHADVLRVVSTLDLSVVIVLSLGTRRPAAAVVIAQRTEHHVVPRAASSARDQQLPLSGRLFVPQGFNRVHHRRSSSGI